MSLTKLYLLCSLFAILVPTTTFSATLRDTVPQKQIVTRESLKKSAKIDASVGTFFVGISSVFLGMSLISEAAMPVILLLQGAAGLVLLLALLAFGSAIRRRRLSKQQNEPCIDCSKKRNQKRQDILIATFSILLGIISAMGIVFLNFLGHTFLAMLLLVLGLFIAIGGIGFGIYILRERKKSKKNG